MLWQNQFCSIGPWPITATIVVGTMQRKKDLATLLDTRPRQSCAKLWLNSLFDLQSAAAGNSIKVWQYFSLSTFVEQETICRSISNHT